MTDDIVTRLRGHSDCYLCRDAEHDMNIAADEIDLLRLEIKYWRSLARTAIAAAEHQIDDLGGPKPMNPFWEKTWGEIDRALHDD